MQTLHDTLNQSISQNHSIFPKTQKGISIKQGHSISLSNALEGVWLGLVKFNRYCNIFVLFENYCQIID
jgi:hypothetical protein